MVSSTCHVVWPSSGSSRLFGSYPVKLLLVRASAHVFSVRLVCSMLGTHPVWCAVAHSSMRMAEHGHFLVFRFRIEYALPWVVCQHGYVEADGFVFVEWC